MYIIHQNWFTGGILSPPSIIIILILGRDRFLNDTTARTFFNKIGIWGISQKPRHLGNFPNKFLRYPGIREVSQIPRHLGNLRMVYLKDFGNFSNTGYLGNFLDARHSHRFLVTPPPQTPIIIIIVLGRGRFLSLSPG